MEEEGHPAPDRMLLAFKPCNNWYRSLHGFRMVGGDEAEEFDDLSEEGRENLVRYIEHVHEEISRRKDEEIIRRSELVTAPSH